MKGEVKVSIAIISVFVIVFLITQYGPNLSPYNYNYVSVNEKTVPRPGDVGSSVCRDSDGGKNYEVRGTAQGINGKSSDRCVDDSNLMEYFCRGDQVDGVVYGCANGCSNGACEEEVGAASYRVFVSKSEYDGTISCEGCGAAWTDHLCEGFADIVGLKEGNWKSWLSDDNVSAADRLYHSPIPYVNLYGNKVADNWDDLTDGTLDFPINVNEYFETNDGSPFVWTGTNTDGSSFAGQNCNNWRSGSNDYTGLIGLQDRSDSLWTFAAVSECGYSPHNFQKHIYCIEQP